MVEPVGEGWELLKISGIPLRVHPSWFVILAITTVMFQARIASDVDQNLAVALTWGVGFLTAVLLFVSVLLHELGHSLMALREGVKVRSITLFLMGGVARVEKECSNAMGSLRVAAAGPLVSLLLAGGFYSAVPWAKSISPILENLFATLGWLNLVLALFNLLPGLPLDGGLILKALIWRVTGSRSRGVQVATASGRALAMTAIILGLMRFFTSQDVGGLWLVLLGWFGLGANRGQTQMLVLQKVLRDLKVAQASSRRFRVLEADQPLRRLSQIRMQDTDGQRGGDWVLICRSGRWIGWVDDKPLRDRPVQQWDRRTLADDLRPLDELPSIRDQSPLWEAVQALENAPEARLLVLSPAGLPSGTIDRMDVGEAVLERLGVRLPPTILEEARKHNNYPLGLVMLPQVVESMQATDPDLVSPKV